MNAVRDSMYALASPYGSATRSVSSNGRCAAGSGSRTTTSVRQTPGLGNETWATSPPGSDTSMSTNGMTRKTGGSVGPRRTTMCAGGNGSGRQHTPVGGSAKLICVKRRTEELSVAVQMISCQMISCSDDSLGVCSVSDLSSFGERTLLRVGAASSAERGGVAGTREPNGVLTFAMRKSWDVDICKIQ